MKTLIALIFSVACLRVSAAEITIDAGKRDQTIEGFGAFGGSIKNWQQNLSPELAETLVSDLGMTISRGPLPFDFQNPDGSFNYSGDVAKWIPMWKMLREKGVQKFIISVWSPPVWMKNPGNHGHKEPWCQDGRAGGFLRPENYEKFADMCVEFLRHFKKEVGIDAYALSLQNEPAFDEPYESCVYSPEQFVALLKVVGKKFEQAHITTKIFGPEDIGWFDRVMKYINGAMDDPEARQQLGIVAVHGYANNGITADSPDAKVWEAMRAPGAKFGKQLWMTETSGYDDSFDGAMKLARAIYTALRFGHVSAWCWWQAAGADDAAVDNQCLTAGLGGKNAPPKFFVSKNFYRFVRPGAVRVEANSDDPDVLPLAFENVTDGTWTIILINNSSAEKPTRILGFGAPLHFKLYRTSSAENCVDAGSAGIGETIKLSAASITTWVGSGLH